MNWKSVISGFCAVLLTLGFCGCVTDSPPREVVCEADVIRVGDTLSVSFQLPVNGPDSGDKEVQVRDDGSINMQLIGPVKAAGKKFRELESELRTMYVPRYFKQLTLVITPRDRFYTVGGEVRSPGRQVYLGETTVLRAIASCGDFNEFANRRKVEILRADGRRDIVNCNKARKDQKYDLKICPGDAIYVPRSL